MEKCYKVTALTKKGGYKEWRIDVEANTAKEAMAKAKELWDKPMHLFDVECLRLKDGEEFTTHCWEVEE